MIDMEKTAEVAKQIDTLYKEGQYTDKDGNLWLGVEAENRADDKWIWALEPGYWLTNGQMMKKMINELMDWDTPAPAEDPYEYAVKHTSPRHVGADFILGNCWGDREERQEAMDRQNGICDEWEKQYGHRPSIYSLVRRRKPGAVEDVK